MLYRGFACCRAEELSRSEIIRKRDEAAPRLFTAKRGGSLSEKTFIRRKGRTVA